LEAAEARMMLGCTNEHASYTPTNCAERTAFFKAVSEGCREFRQIAIVGGYMEEERAVTGDASDRAAVGGTACETTDKADEPSTPDYCPPCGVCRQVMAEFCDAKTFRILVARSPEDYLDYTLEELLPLNFGPKDLL
ncbi:MAG: hypothetical protein LUF30_00905, partial [Lachnospiraceae bacterium]|nr:hypothetical protein [Lachnospiraceae bacterium]